MIIIQTTVELSDVGGGNEKKDAALVNSRPSDLYMCDFRHVKKKL